MTYCHTFLPGHCFSCFGLDPDTPSEDYEIRGHRALPPDRLARNTPAPARRRFCIKILTRIFIS